MVFVRWLFFLLMQLVFILSSDSDERIKKNPEILHNKSNKRLYIYIIYVYYINIYIYIYIYIL